MTAGDIQVAGTQVEKDRAVILGVEYVGASISTLGDVVRQSWNDNSFAPQHAKGVSLGSAKPQKVEEGVVVPDL